MTKPTKRPPRPAGFWRRLLPILAAAGLLAPLASGGCATAPELKPAPEATILPGSEDTAVSDRRGVRMVVEAGAWPGRSEVRNHVTPLRVTIQNNSNNELRVRYEDFRLVSSQGEVYSALPPFAIEGEITEPVASAAPIRSPAFAHSRYMVAPYAGSHYPGLTPYAGSFPYDPTYYDHYHSYWARIPLPTEEMLRQLLPEGVLQPGGRVSGFLYFEPVSGEEQRLMFRANLVQAGRGAVFGTVEIPFMITR